MAQAPEIISVTGTIGPVATLKDGRIITLFVESYRDDVTQEHPERSLFLRVSEDGGVTWSAAEKVFAYPAGRGMLGAATPLVDHQGNLHVFALRFYSLGWSDGKWHSILVHRRRDNQTGEWSELKQIDFGHDYTGALNSALQMNNGRILVPLSYLAEDRRDGKFVSMVVYSDDVGETWACANDCVVSNGGDFLESGAIEPVVVQLNSGMVWMLIRTTLGYFWESFSNDGGIWTPPRETRIVSSNAPAGLLRLTDGRIVMFWNNLYGEPFREGISYARQILHGAISTDDGQTWSIPRPIVQRHAHEPFKAQTTYPFLCQAGDGAIVLMYHRVYAQSDRDWYNPIRELVRVDPNWLAAG